MTLTTRLTFFFVATLAAVLIAFSIALYLLTQSQLYRELDARSETGRGMLTAAVETEPIGLEWDTRAEYMRQIPRETLQWAGIDETGLIAGSGLAKDLYPLLPELTSDDMPLDVDIHHQPWRMVRKVISHPNPQNVVTTNPALKRYQQLTFLIAVPMAPVRQALQALAFRLAAITCITLLVVTLIARWVCQKALLAAQVTLVFTNLLIVAASKSQGVCCPPEPVLVRRT